MMSNSAQALKNSPSKIPKEYREPRGTVYDQYRFLTEYRDTFNNLEHTYKPGEKSPPKILDPKPGMLRALDFTPSTDLGQQFFDYKYRFQNDKTSHSIGYAPAFMKIQHVNNPMDHRLHQYKYP
mmetsp:Transcript_18765/g.17910  ORF Transcript_18765/g.17910 Transcript_18765/m.17910 type:complete len:124 (+) Transcript_18765:932-1303(+)